MRSPRRSCSPTRASRSATKPRSTPSVISETEPASLRRTEAQSSSGAASLNPMLPQQVGQPFAGAAGPGGDDDAPPLGAPTFHLRTQLLEHADARPAGRLREHRTRPPAAIDTGRAFGPGERREGQARAERQHLIPFVTAEIQFLRRQRPIRHLAIPRRSLPRLGVIGDHFQARFQHLVRLMIQADRGVRQIIQQIFHHRMEQRHPMLHAGMTAALGDRQIDRVLRRVGAEDLAPPGAEAGDRRLVQRQFGHRP